MKKLTGKTCLVTGAARGIGESIAQSFKEEGAEVIVTDINEEDGSNTANRIGARFYKLDVSKEADWINIATVVPELDVLVNNAGITGFESASMDSMPVHDPENAKLSEWRSVHQVNLDGTFLGCRYAIRAMRKKKNGSIINISSRSGMIGIPTAAAYASSKAAVRNHTKSVALYCAGQGLNIRCNSIHPAAILTPMWEPMLGNDDEREARSRAIVADTPLKRFGHPNEVAAIAVLLASDEATYMTGAELTLDGGILAGATIASG